MAQEEIEAYIHNDLGISFADDTNNDESKYPKPDPRKFAVSASITHKKCSSGENHAEASTGGIDDMKILGRPNTAYPRSAIQ